MLCLLRTRGLAQVRYLASESRLSDWALYPDTSHRSQAEAKSLLNATVGGDDNFEPKVVRRTYGTKDEPNLVPIRGHSRLVACTCSPTDPELHYMLIHRHNMVQCPCKFWYKAVDEHELEFEKNVPLYA